MSRAFSDLAFTPTVREWQARQGSRAAYAKFDAPEAVPNDRLGEAEAAFVAARDHFFMATVGETGWPYLQHRGGPVGFLRVLDPQTLGFADYRGNRQHVSNSNLVADPRVSLFLMDYPNRRRLKILGHAQVISAADQPALVGQLMPEGMPGTSTSLPPDRFDPEEARRLLRAAGVPEGARIVLHGPNDRYLNDEKVLVATRNPYHETLRNDGREFEFRLCGKRYVLPADEVVLLETDNISCETLARAYFDILSDELGDELRSPNILSVSVFIEETPGQGAAFQRER